MRPTRSGIATVFSLLISITAFAGDWSPWIRLASPSSIDYRTKWSDKQGYVIELKNNGWMSFDVSINEEEVTGSNSNTLRPTKTWTSWYKTQNVTVVARIHGPNPWSESPAPKNALVLSSGNAPALGKR